MKTILTVLDHKINVTLDEHMIHLTNDDSLTNLLAIDTEARTEKLVHSIKLAYYKLFNKNLEISDTSMCVEIWAHMYTEKFAVAVEKVSSIGFVDKLAEKVIERCEIIDIGELGHDYNRFVWNGLAPLKSMIAKFLPGDGSK